MCIFFYIWPVFKTSHLFSVARLKNIISLLYTFFFLGQDFLKKKAQGKAEWSKSLCPCQLRTEYEFSIYKAGYNIFFLVKKETNQVLIEFVVQNNHEQIGHRELKKSKPLQTFVKLFYFRTLHESFLEEEKIHVKYIHSSATLPTISSLIFYFI